MSRRMADSKTNLLSSSRAFACLRGLYTMVGLVYVESLQLTPAQWAALGLHAAGWMWCWRWPERWLLTTLLTLSVLWIAFWNVFTCIDQQLLFQQAGALSRLPWEAFIEEIARRPYVEYQTPFLTFWFSRVPIFWLHQLVWFLFGLLCAGLLWQLFGRQAALLIATPVFALMVHQPCHDTLLFGMLLIVLRLIQMRQRIAAALVYGLTWAIKPLTILTAPFLLYQLGVAGTGSLALWGSYVLWSRRWFFGRYQFPFLLQQLMLGRQRSAASRKKTAQSLPQSAVFRSIFRRLWHTVRWRWDTLGHRAILALPFYLFPVWLRPWTRKGITLAAVILFGYGNIKYLLLDLLFLFPVVKEMERILPGHTILSENEYVAPPHIERIY